MPEIRIRNWDKWQSYRRDRGKPPWVKVYKRLLLDPNWVQLTDSQKGQIVTLWLLAGDRDGVLPTPTGWQGDVNVASQMLAKLGQMDSTPDLQALEQLGFIVLDVSMTSAWRQDDVNMTGQSRAVQYSTELRDDDEEATEIVQFDPAIPRAGVEVGLPPEAANIPSLKDASEKQLQEVARLAEVVGISPEQALAATRHKTWTVRSASVVIERLNDELKKRSGPKTFSQQKRDNTDRAIAEVMEGLRGNQRAD